VFQEHSRTNQLMKTAAVLTIYQNFTKNYNDCMQETFAILKEFLDMHDIVADIVSINIIL